ncbi:MAG: hypothetical protein Kow00108_08700 [Calditrichia bacterium]
MKLLGYQSKKIIFEEFYNFFTRFKPEYVLVMNHLDELIWMKNDEVGKQFEFFTLDSSLENSLRSKFFMKNYPSIQSGEDEFLKLRLAVRNYLGRKFGVPEVVNPDIPSDESLESKLETMHFYYTEPALANSIEMVYKKWLMVGVAVIVLLAIIFSILRFSQTPSAKLIVNTNGVDADVYMDTTLIGRSNQVIDLFRSGAVKIFVKRNNFLFQPSSRNVTLKKDSTIIVDFKAIPLGKEKIGFVKISANVDEADIYIDEEYYGNYKDFPFVRLIEGEHRIELRKQFYEISPSVQIVQVAEADTQTISFDFHLPDNRRLNKTEENLLSGYLEVSSNIPGALILLNQERTSFTTDHIFTNLDFGQYTVSLEKEGYQFDPKYQHITLNKNNPSEAIRFVGNKVVNMARITVNPSEAKILIDREYVGTGTFAGELRIGEHELAIEAPDGFAPFSPRKFRIKPGVPFEQTINLIPYFNYTLSIDERGNVKFSGLSFRTGYMDEIKGFKYSESVGPEVIFDDKLGTYAWKFGFAFPFRTPPGNDAVQISFNMKYDLRQLDKVKLYIKAASTGEAYPMAIKPVAIWKVLFNNFKLHEIQQINNSKQNEWQQYIWDITNLLKYGKNMIEISLLEDNNTFIFVKEITISNQ